MAFLRRIAEQQVDQGAFLWLLREGLARGRRASLDDLRGVDRRLAGHLAGLALAGRAVWPLVRAPLERPSSGERFLAAAVALRLDDTEAPGECFAECLPECVGADVRGAAGGARYAAHELAAALEWAACTGAGTRVGVVLGELAASPDPTRRLAAAAARARLRRPEGLAAALDDDDFLVRARAARAAGELGAAALVPALVCALDASATGGRRLPAERVRRWAAWSIVRLGAPDAAGRAGAVLRAHVAARRARGGDVGTWWRLAADEAAAPDRARAAADGVADGALRTAPQVQRREAAWRLGRARPSAVLFPIAAPAHRQDALLDASTAGAPART